MAAESSHHFPPSHPSPGEYVEVLGELRGVESRLQPFLQRYEEILGTADTADYNNNVRGIVLYLEKSSILISNYFSLLHKIKTSNGKY